MRQARMETPGKDERVQFSSLVRAWRMAQEYHVRIYLYLATILVTSLVASLPPIVFKSIIDNAIPKHSYSTLTLDVILVLALTLTQSGIGILNRYLSSYVGEGIIYKLRALLFEHIQRMPISFFTKSQTGALISRLNNDVIGSQQTISTLASVISDVSTLIFTLTLMFSLSPLITLISLVFVPVIIILDRRIGSRLSRLSRIQMQANAEMSQMEEERFNVAGALLVTFFGNKRREAAQFSGYAGQVRDAGIRVAISSRAYFTALSLFGGVATVAAYGIGGYQAIKGTITLGAIVALAQYVGRLYAPLTDLATSRVSLLQALVSFDRVFEILDADPPLKDPEHPIAIPSTRGDISIEHVDFSYPETVAVRSLAKQTESERISEADHKETSYVFEDLNLTIEAGQMVALVGPSGAGKTTITNLINRLYDPDHGRITLDGIDLRDIAQDDLHSFIGVVSQDPHLFHDSILSNLRYARPEATIDEVIEATTAAQIHELIDSLPNGYETTVGERGYRLSGGEKQRLSIARVFLKRPQIVILDEATSSLDSENEALIQKAISTMLDKRTSIVIAHRLSTILVADRIVVVADGRIAETGTHAELLGHGGLYARLYETQFGNDVGPEGEE